MVNEIEASQLSDIEFKMRVIRKFNELTENYPKLQGNYEKLTANHINMKKDIETIKEPWGNENTISELKNIVERIKSRLDEAKDQISELDGKVDKNSQKEYGKEKG